jgi:hypothetical protein
VSLLYTAYYYTLLRERVVVVSPHFTSVEYAPTNNQLILDLRHSNAIQTLPLSLANCTSLERLHLGAYRLLCVGAQVFYVWRMERGTIFCPLSRARSAHELWTLLHLCALALLL